MSRASNEWVCWADIGHLGGRPKAERKYNPATKKMEKTGEIAQPIEAGKNVSYIERAGETIGAGCNLPSLGEAFSEVYGMPFSPGDRSRITQRFARIENEERAVRWDSRVGYTIKMPIPNSIPVERIPDLAHDVISLVLQGKHEYAFSVHRGGISAKDRAAMNEKEVDPRTGEERFTPHARALRRVLRSEDNRHIHFVFRERPIGHKNKNSVRWMQAKQAKTRDFHALRSCPADPDGAREHYGFDDALATVLTNQFGFRIVKKASTDDTRKRIGQKKFKANMKQKIRDAEKDEIREDMGEIVKNYKQDYQQAEAKKTRIVAQINELDRIPTPAPAPQPTAQKTPADLAQMEREARALANGEIVPDDAVTGKSSRTGITHDHDHVGIGIDR